MEEEQIPTAEQKILHNIAIYEVYSSFVSVFISLISTSALKNFINERRRRNERGNDKQRGNQGSNGSNVVRTNGVIHSYPNFQVQSSVASQHIGENELGPELSRLFSGLTTLSNNGGNESTPEVSKSSKAINLSADGPSDSSPIRTRAQLSSLRRISAPIAPSELNAPHSKPSGLVLNGAVSPLSQEPRLAQLPALPLATSKPVTPPRKASGTADISPYLSNLPVSAKTLQHLQLLETVADESARMAPILAARAALVRQGVTQNNPTSATSSSNSHDLIYSSNHPSHVPYPNHLPLGESLPVSQQGPFQRLRSRTSQSFNRPIAAKPPVNMTMHQNHLLAVINGTRSVPVTPNYPFFQQPQHPPLFNSGLPPPQPFNQAYIPSTTPSYLPVAPTTLPTTLPAPVSGTENSFTHVSSPAPIMNAPTSHSVPSLPHVNYDSNPGSNISPPVSNPLLSILNGRHA